mgnify:FL=1
MAGNYKFYIQKYPQGSTTFSKVDMESTFGCIYRSLTKSQDRTIKNIYTEDFPESSKARVYVPAPSELAYENNTCVLSVLFHAADALSRAETLRDYIGGQKLEFSDNFRNRYIQLLPQKYEVSQEILYKGRNSFQVINITCMMLDVPKTQSVLA